MPEVAEEGSIEEAIIAAESEEGIDDVADDAIPAGTIACKLPELALVTMTLSPAAAPAAFAFGKSIGFPDKFGHEADVAMLY